MPQLLDLALRATASPDVLYRSYALEEFDFRDNAETGGWTFHGTAAVVDHPYPVRDQFGTYTETIRAGAFDRSLKDIGQPISLLVNHRKDDTPLSNRAAGMTVVADPHLRVVAELDSSRPDVQIIRSAVQSGIMREMSIGFKPVKAQDVWAQDYKSVERGMVTLREMSIVEQGANTGGTQAEVRSLDEFMVSLTDIEMDAADIERVIAYFESRRPMPDDDQFAERDRKDRERLERLKHAPAA